MATKPAGLPRSEQHLAIRRFGPTPAEIWMPVCLCDLGDQLAQHAQRLLDAGEVRVGLVEAHRLQAVELRAHELPHLARLLAVGGEVGRDDDRRRAQPPRLRGRHRRPDAELARLVGRGGHDRARPGAGDDHRLALQVRALEQLDRGVERVAVEVGDDALRGHSTDGKSGPGRTYVRIGYRVTWIGPWPLKRSLRAVAAVRSYSRPPTYGPRSITRTRTTRPRWRIVTLVPHGSDLLATPTVP